MKSIKLKRNRLFAAWTILMAVIIFTVINSCKKDLRVIELGQVEKTSPLADVNVQELQRIYSIETGLQTNGSNTQNKLKFVRQNPVNWSRYFQKDRSESRVVDFEVANDSNLVVLEKLKAGQKNNFRNRTRAVFLEFNNGKRLNFYMKIVEDISKNSGVSVIDYVHYDYIPNNFNGVIFYFSFSNNFINGYRYLNGRIVKSATVSPTPVKGDAVTKQGNDRLQVNVIQCQTYDVYEVWCEWGGTTENPYQYFHGCEETYIGTVMECGDDGYNPGGGGAGGDGNYGGGGGGTAPTNPNPCSPPAGVMVSVEKNGGKKIHVVQPPDGGGGGGGGTPPPCPPSTEQKDEDLKNALDNNPALLIKCAVLEAFKSLATYKTPSVVNNRLAEFNDPARINHSVFYNKFYVQQMQNAFGYNVNMDRFEINIDQLPTVNNHQMTAPEFLNYIRLNINNFVDQSTATFEPYVDNYYQINDGPKWQSSNPMGAMLHLQMDDNGSVIVSDYATDHWTVSTVRTPLDGDHPVSGNRSWGYVALPNNKYKFYVTGADRLTAPIHQLAQSILNLPFSSADHLWESYQSKLSAFVNSHQGTATVGATTKERPDYSDIRDYLDGKLTIQQLKAKNLCD